MRATESPNDSACQNETAGNPAKTSQPSKPANPCECPSPTLWEQEQEQPGSGPRISQEPLQTPEQQEGGSSVDLRRESGLESADQTSSVDVSAYARYDAGETIGKFVAYPPHQLSALTRIPKHPTPGHGTLVTLSNG
ncbi:hypothetical protein PF005_g30978 [Phytophthora fragariae]|uniref:Uncharacterized protein n=1 Tax=Phytophthora fragariae TaxID=53985 RepID=A0A6A3VB62_9STRA|nr:hypothetical protein PF011_g23996 [Phytophthora fragariae]KAE9162127.1 hypothetical protein PF005_g30978 [Phytophthora fragariae]KAE9166161.1 hypothetical protein PF002_g31186 [Phytophthora fragariae]